jgi:hypothetical protein
VAQGEGDGDGAGFCMPTLHDGDIGPAVCGVIGGLFALMCSEQCDVREERFCILPSECGANETCVVSARCAVAFCAATQFP